MSLVWLDGALLPVAEARVSVEDFGLLYGASCFETMRAVEGRVFRLSRHLQRLTAGVRALQVEPPNEARLTAAIADTIEANSLRDARVRLTVTAGKPIDGGPAGPDLGRPRQPGVLVTATPAAEPPAPASVVVSAIRLDEGRPLRDAKSGNYLPFLLARSEARAAGHDEALLLNGAGHLAEASTANVFLVREGDLVTPGLVDGPLPGITREAVLECARGLGLTVEERSCSVGDLEAADELFLTNSVLGLWPVRALMTTRARRLDAAPGPVTHRLAGAYEALVRAECGD